MSNIKLAVTLNSYMGQLSTDRTLNKNKLAVIKCIILFSKFSFSSNESLTSIELILDDHCQAEIWPKNLIIYMSAFGYNNSKYPFLH